MLGFPALDSTPQESAVFGLLGVAAAVAGYCLFGLVLLRSEKKTPALLPPSPPGEFLLGHYRVVPVDAPFRKYAEWGQQYSMCKPRWRGFLVSLL